MVRASPKVKQISYSRGEIDLTSSWEKQYDIFVEGREEQLVSSFGNNLLPWCFLSATGEPAHMPHRTSHESVNGQVRGTWYWTPAIVAMLRTESALSLHHYRNYEDLCCQKIRQLQCRPGSHWANIRRQLGARQFVETHKQTSTEFNIKHRGDYISQIWAIILSDFIFYEENPCISQEQQQPNISYLDHMMPYTIQISVHVFLMFLALKKPYSFSLLGKIMLRF